MALEVTGENGVVVRNYTSNFDIKEYIREEMMPKAFPNIPMAKITTGFTGMISEYMAQAIEDSFATASLMMNESFVTRAILPSSIYSEASLYNLGYTFATPSRCNFALQIWLPDIIKYATKTKDSNMYRYYLDKDTKLIIGDNAYKLDYDIIIEYQILDGKKVFNVYYDMTDYNSISKVTNKFIKHQVTSIDWMVLFVELQEFDRVCKTKPITDNLVTTNSDIKIKWSRQIAGIDLVYISPSGNRQRMELKNQYTKASIDPFAWYRFESDNTIILSFSNNSGYFSPAFNSKIEYTIYTCNGAAADFNKYDNKSGISVQKTGNKYSYNTSTKMVALCYSGSTGGLDKGDIELLRDDVIMARNTANVLISDTDLDLWFQRFGKRYGTRSKFFKRRDDPSGKIFSQFIAITDSNYVYPTNTLSIIVSEKQFDYINKNSGNVDQEFIIKPGHLWEYNDKDGIVSRDTLRMVEGPDGLAMITDESLPSMGADRPFMFVNPFYIKIYREPTVSMNYNYLINDTSWPEDLYSNQNSLYQFQLATFNIERTLSSKNNDKYRLQVICVPVITTDKTYKYVEGIGDDYSLSDNNLRLILVTRSNSDGDTGYIEMKPVEFRTGGSILFETEFVVHDNINTDMTLEIDLEKTPDMKSLISHGINKGKVIIDSQESSFHFICMIRDLSKSSNTGLFNDIRYDNYVMTNRFANAHRDLVLYKPMSMMQSTIEFSGENDDYTVKASLIPFLRYDIPLDNDKMTYFIQAFSEQYRAMEPVLSLLGDASLDLKLYNTYGRSNNYYIGPEDGSNTLWDSNILIDNVYVKIKFILSVYDRSLYTQTVSAIISEIKKFFDSLDSGSLTDIHASDLIHVIKDNQPNVHYIRFVGFNEYDANKQSIFVKETNTKKMSGNKLATYVPEIIRADKDSIEITEEV